MRRLFLASVGLGVALAPAISAAHTNGPPCASEQGAALSAALEQDPTALSTRLRAADAYLMSNCIDRAVDVLEAGEALHPRNRELQSRLRTARSMLSEQVYFAGLDQAEQAAKLTRLQLRCTRLADLTACNEASALRPDDANVALAAGDAFVKANQPAEALSAYRRAATLAPSDSIAAEKMVAVQGQLQALFTRCQNDSGVAALQACDAALIRGAENEFAIHKRKAILLQSANQPQALDSYIAASLLRADDKSVALGIVTLSDGAGRKDAVTLAARGAALLTLDRATDAVAPLREAAALAPELSGVHSQLAAAERLAAREARRRLAAVQTPAPAAPIAVAEGGASTPRYSNAATPTRSN